MDEKVFFGTRKSDRVKIYLKYPTWDCGWYWSFGYLGNRNEHYHLSSLSQGTPMFESLPNNYNLNESIQKDLFKFCELATTAYTLKNVAEVLGFGGSNITNNPCKHIIINKDEVVRINTIVLPAIFDEIAKILKQ